MENFRRHVELLIQDIRSDYLGHYSPGEIEVCAKYHYKAQKYFEAKTLVPTLSTRTPTTQVFFHVFVPFYIFFATCTSALSHNRTITRTLSTLV